MWVVGFISSLVYVLIYFQSKIYGYAVLYVYYLGVSIYGWYSWRNAYHPDGSASKLHISRIRRSLAILLAVLFVVLYIASGFALERYTDSPVPFYDALGTSLSIIATWMLARKILEHWILWFFVNLFSATLCFYQELYPTSCIFVVYTVLSVVGWFKWKRSIIIQKSKN